MLHDAGLRCPRARHRHRSAFLRQLVFKSRQRAVASVERLGLSDQRCRRHKRPSAVRAHRQPPLRHLVAVAVDRQLRHVLEIAASTHAYSLHRASKSVKISCRDTRHIEECRRLAARRRVRFDHAHIAHRCLRRNHRQGKQKQWYGKDRFHIDAKLVISTKIECCF